MMQVNKTTLLISLAVNAAFIFIACAGYTPPNSWTLRDDCHARASQRNEDFDIHQFIEKVKKEEGHDFGILVSPDGAKSIADEINSCHIDLTACQNKNPSQSR